MTLSKTLGSGLILLLLAGATGCGQREPAVSDFMTNAVPVKPADRANAEAVNPAPSRDVVDAAAGSVGESDVPPPEPGAPQKPPQPPGTPTTTSALLLAYSYKASFALPTQKVASTMAAHRQKCEQAGPANCQIVMSSSSNTGEDSVVAELNLRATPAWLTTFRASLEQDAKAANGKLETQSVSSEDLTRNITDTEAQVRALKALRTRLEALIASRPGKLSDLLEAERELARVQGDIDSFDSNLSVMRARVTMSTMELSYRTGDTAIGGGTFRPVSDAFTNFFRIMAESFAVVLTMIAAILPFALFAAPFVYLGVRWRRKRAAAKVLPKPEVG